MSKVPSIADYITKGTAGAPADTDTDAKPAAPPPVPRPESARKSRTAPAKPAKVDKPADPPPRKMPWDGKDELTQVSHRWPERVKLKLNYAKVAGLVEGAAEFSAEATEAALDKLLAQYVKDGGFL